MITEIKTPTSATKAIIPSIEFDPEEIKKISGADKYEERLLCLMIGQKDPTVVVTSSQVAPELVRYYIGLTEKSLPAIKERIQSTYFFSTGEGVCCPLTEKILRQPALVEVLGELTKSEGSTLQAIVGSDRIDQVARCLSVEGVEAKSEHQYYGSKTGSRQIFHEAGIPYPVGVPHPLGGDHDLLDHQQYLRSVEALVESMARLMEQGDGVYFKEWIVKLNEGFSGKGNARLTLQETESGMQGLPLRRALTADLARVIPEHTEMTSEDFLSAIPRLGVVAEAFIEGQTVRSPSYQGFISEAGEVTSISTHEQILNGQVYAGCQFPADPRYSETLMTHGHKVGQALAKEGVKGHFAVDFLAVESGGPWQLYGLETNLRLSGTSYPMAALSGLTKGRFDGAQFVTKKGQTRCYVASDLVEVPSLKGTKVEEFLKIVQNSPFHWDQETERGVVVYLLGNLEAYGRFGAVFMEKTPDAALKLKDDFKTYLHEGRKDFFVKPDSPLCLKAKV